MPAAVEIKIIKPQRFNDAAFRAAIEAAAREAAAAMQKDFEETTKTWKHKPKFVKEVSVDPNAEILVGTDDQIYRYVNDGTGGKGKGPTYPIPKTPRPWPLKFRWGGKGSYKAKTRPGQLWSQPGGPTGPIVRFKQVRHPGIEPRNFDKDIEKDWQPKFKRRMEQAMSDAAKASGHGIP